MAEERSRLEAAGDRRAGDDANCAQMLRSRPPVRLMATIKQANPRTLNTTADQWPRAAAASEPSMIARQTTHAATTKPSW